MSSGPSAAERAAKLEAMMAFEAPPQRHRMLTTLDGLASGEIESLTAPRPDCSAAGGETTCEFAADLGKDGDGDPVRIVCNVSTDFSPFGVTVRHAVSALALQETPQMSVRAVGEGIAATFVANAAQEDEHNVYLSTVKVAALYAHGFMARCVDLHTGGRKTFDRVTQHFFESLKLKDNPRRSAVFALGYQDRVGDRARGFRYDFIARRGDDGGFVEQGTHFWLETDGKTWQADDFARIVERDATGAVEKMQHLFWRDGQGPASLSAKPSEDKKFRLKLEAGARTNGLEATVKAPLNTELWAAPELLRVGSGTLASYRYAFLDLEDSDPSFNYVQLTRQGPGVLIEEQDSMKKGRKGASGSADQSAKNELHLDARGLVTKQISSRSVSDLVYTWGDLPAPVRGKKTAAVGPADAMRPKPGTASSP